MRRIRIFDTGPLSTFTNADMLGVLKILCEGYECVRPTAVTLELQNGCRGYPGLSKVLEAEWICEVDLDTTAELSNFVEVSKYTMRADSDRDLGETAVIGWALSHPGAQLVMDDQRARTIARDRFKLEVTGSIGILIDAVKAELVSEVMANSVADELRLSSNGRLPFREGQFMRWVRDQGVI